MIIGKEERYACPKCNHISKISGITIPKKIEQITCPKCKYEIKRTAKEWRCSWCYYVGVPIIIKINVDELKHKKS